MYKKIRLSQGQFHLSFPFSTAKKTLWVTVQLCSPSRCTWLEVAVAARKNVITTGSGWINPQHKEHSFWSAGASLKMLDRRIMQSVSSKSTSSITWIKTMFGRCLPLVCCFEFQTDSAAASAAHKLFKCQSSQSDCPVELARPTFGKPSLTGLPRGGSVEKKKYHEVKRSCMRGVSLI